MKANLSIFYVYSHHRATDGTIFYIGKGSGIRAHSRRGRTLHWRNIVKRHGLIVTIAAGGLDEHSAFALEKKMIANVGRERLCNLTDGGEGPAGHIHSEENRKSISLGTKRAFAENPTAIEKLRAAQIGRKHTEATKAKQRSAKLGKYHRPETIDKMRLAKIGKFPSAETRQKMADARKGRKHSPEAIKKMRDKASIRSAETIARQVAANTGKIRSDAIRANMSASQKGKAIECSNGMIFEKITYAAAWLKENGHPKASIQAIAKASSKENGTSYGLKWKIRADLPKPTPT